MWIRKSMMLSALIMSSSMYGFGSSDLAEIKGLFSDLDKSLAAQTLHASSTKEDRENALTAARAARAQFFHNAFVTSTSFVLECSIAAIRIMMHNNAGK